ncbi:MAG: peptidase C69 [Bacteroidetes bacterium HGW-Bacteroidetes-4]|nr:MAG: peptidase C69 [Bacteroidetes bacterium HGW-Bacteroidetes-4]
MKKRIHLIFLLLSLNIYFLAMGQVKPDWQGGVPEGCTSVTVGKLASVDGSVMTSHTDDSHRTRSWMDIIPAKDHKPGSTVTMYKRTPFDSMAMPSYKHTPIGTIPQIDHTFAYVNTAYPSLNEKQLGIGESTFGGRSELQSDEGLIDCQRLCQLMLERCETARDAIKMADQLTKQYGWNDDGECLTIADKKEVWHFEIVGPGKGKTGAVWVAQRVPDEHISVNANASTVKEIDLNNTDFYMASENIFSVAKENGWWNENQTFSFCHVYAPESRESIAARRREWRVFDMVAPSLKLDPNDKDYPFSVKPDEKITLETMVTIFKDYYEGTPYDMTRNIKTTDKDGKTIVSPLANPFMPYDQLELQNVQGGWYHVDKKTGKIDFLGERTIARWYTMYGTIIQCRDWLPDDIGGVLWLAQDNIATSVYIPVYAGTTDLPQSYKTPGRVNGFTYESAWWAFNRMSSLAAQRWGDMRHNVDAVFVPMQKELFKNQAAFEKEALELSNPKKRKKILTEYTMEHAEQAVKKAWKLGDDIWTKYDELF